MSCRTLVCALVFLAGCAPAAEDTSSSTTTSEGTTSSSSSDGGTATGTTTSKPQKAILQASFVAEEKAGDAPALLRMFNETPDQILSLTLDDNNEYLLYLVDPLTTSDYAITMSDDMFEDAILSIHTFDSCVRKPFAEVTGPLALEPGHAFSIHVTIDQGFAGFIEEDAMPEPYTGVRAHVFDPSGSTAPAPAELVLSTKDAAQGDITYKTIFTEFPEPYLRIPGSKIEIEKIRFVDRSGVAHEASVPVALEGSHGYTVYIDDEPREGAATVIPLDDLAE